MMHLIFLVNGIPFRYMFVCDAIPLWTINKIRFKNALELSQLWWVLLMLIVTDKPFMLSTIVLSVIYAQCFK